MRIRPGDGELWQGMVEEARRLCETDTPMPQGVARLIKLAGDNPRAFEGIGENSTKELGRTAEGQTVLRVLGTAAAEWKLQTMVGVPRVVGRKRTSEEKTLATMPVPEGFDVLAQQEPRLLTVADEVVRVAGAARSTGGDESLVRAKIGEIAIDAIMTNPIVGPKAPGRSGLLATPTAVQVVWTHLASIASVSLLDLA